jgi:hypothetical protein
MAAASRWRSNVGSPCDHDPLVLAGRYAEFMPPPKSAATGTIRAGLIELLNDPGITETAPACASYISARRSRHSSSTCAPRSPNRDHGAAILREYEVGAFTRRSTSTPIPKVLIDPDPVLP